MELCGSRFRVLPFSARRQNRFDSTERNARRPVDVHLDRVSGRSNRNPSNHSERSAILICLRAAVRGSKAADRARSPDGEPSSAVAGRSRGGRGLHLTMVRTSQESRRRVRSSSPVSRRLVRSGAVAVAVERRPDERAAAPRGARSHPADDRRRWSR